jgi:hypothetical protein
VASTARSPQGVCGPCDVCPAPDVSLVDPVRDCGPARRLEAVNRQTGPRMITLEDFKVNQVVREKFFTTLCMVTDR